MSSARRSRKKSKQARHSKPAESPSEAVSEVVSAPAKRPEKKRTASASPITAAGGLSWQGIALKAPAVKPEKEPVVAVSSQLINPFAGIAMTFVCTIGLALTGRWSLALLAGLGLVMLIDPRVRSNTELLVRIVAGSALCMACFPLISRLPDTISGSSLGAIGCLVVAMFSLALWLIGSTARRVSSLQDRVFPQVGLYSVGMACQVLCFFMISLAAVLSTLLVASLL